MQLTPIARDIVTEAQRYAGWGYGAGLTVAEQDKQRRIDCSSLTARILCAVWGLPIGGESYSALVLTAEVLRSSWGPWAPTAYVRQLSRGERIDLHDLHPGEAALVQEWSRLPSFDGHRSDTFVDPGRGHAYIVIGSEEPGLVHLLESTNHPATPTGTRAAGVTWRDVDDVGQRWQYSLGLAGPDILVPISSLGHHRAAVLYPRATRATSPASVAATLSPGASPSAPTEAAEALPSDITHTPWIRPDADAEARIDAAIPPHQESDMPRHTTQALRPAVLRRLERAGYPVERLQRVERVVADGGASVKPVSPLDWLRGRIQLAELVTLVRVVAEVAADGKVTGEELLAIGAAVVDLLDD